jgi:formyl-CoA transferase
MTGEHAAGPLTGVTVVEFAQALSTPSCGTLLYDLGAEVIKVEPPRGDTYRLQNRTHVKHEGRDFAIANRGKRSICLDLGHDDAMAVIDRLVADADVALVSMKAPDIPRYGLDYHRLSGVNSALVYLQNTPYGPAGPYGDQGGYDVVAMGLSGLTTVVANAAGDQPRFIRPAFADVVTGMLGALGVTAALRHRDDTGEGQMVETSLLHTSLGVISNFAYRYDELDGDKFAEFADNLATMQDDGADFLSQQRAYEDHFGGRPAGNIYFRHYRTADGFVSVGCLSPRLNERFRESTGLFDPRRTGDLERGSDEERRALDLLVTEAEALLASRTTADWVTNFHDHGLPAAPVNFPHEIYDDPQAIANGYVTSFEHRDLGRISGVTAPLKLSASPLRADGVSPRIGEHTNAVLAEIGYDDAERDDLIARSVVGPRT